MKQEEEGIFISTKISLQQTYSETEGSTFHELWTSLSLRGPDARRRICRSRNDAIIRLIQFVVGGFHYICDDYRNNKITGKVTPSNFNIIIILLSLYILRACGLYKQVWCQLTSHL